MLLEVIVQTVADAREAARGGAGRLEVVRALADGGLTPPLSLVRAIAAEVALPLRVMVRENVGYGTDQAEAAALRRAAQDFASYGVDGIVVGFAREGQVAIDELRTILDAAPGVRVTFHRAFETLSEPLSAVDGLAAFPAIDRILTSGGTGSSVSRVATLRALQDRAGDRLTIIAGGGIDDEMVAALVEAQCVRELHVGRAARAGNDPERPVAAERVRRLCDIIERPSQHP